MTTLLSTAKGLIRSFVGIDPPTEMDVEEPLKEAGLFAQCSFAIIRTAGLGNEAAEAVCENRSTTLPQILILNRLRKNCAYTMAKSSSTVIRTTALRFTISLTSSLSHMIFQTT